MMNEFTLTLNSPLTEEQWDTITDVDFEHTNDITFHTKHGKEVVFKKASAQPEQRWIPVTEKLPEPCDTKTENVLNSNWTIYSDRVKTELETQGITTRELADKLNITPITMHRYLKGDRIPRGPVIAQTATVLNVTCDYLVGLSDDPHKTSEEK